MKVKQLIKELKKMPKDLRVGIAHHDNSEEEVAGWVSYVMEFDKENFEIGDVFDKRMFNDMPNKCIILRC